MPSNRASPARIIYKEPPPPAQPRAPAQNQAHDRCRAPTRHSRRESAAWWSALPRRWPRNRPKRLSPAEERRALYLRDGDVIPSVITKIDEEGVWFKTSLSSSTFVPHAKVKAVELANEPPNSSDHVRLTKSKRDRLLTLPRMQKADPPTHLIRSKNGDYLRGRVSQMDDKNLEVEVRLENKDVPRDRISRIIWLHADELDESEEIRLRRPRPALRRAFKRCATTACGSRSTPSSSPARSLSGKSDVLGACQVAVKQMDQLLIGAAIDQAAAQLTISNGS